MSAAYSVNCPERTPTPTPDPVIDDPIQDVIEEEVTVDPETAIADPFETNLIELKDTETFADDPLIDEPVTGAGNDDLWESAVDCELDEGGDSCSVGGPVEEELEPAE